MIRVRAAVLAGLAVAALLLAPAMAQTVPTTSGAAAAAHNEYVLGSGDVLRIIVFGAGADPDGGAGSSGDLSGQYTVSGTGVLSLPLIGDIPATGKTVAQVREEIVVALKDGYIKSPSVSAEILSYRPYFILGEVNKPGQYPYMDGMTVINAIATAGGYTYRANQKYVYIKSASDLGEHKVRVNDALPIQPGDTVRIVERLF